MNGNTVIATDDSGRYRLENGDYEVYGGCIKKNGVFLGRQSDVDVNKEMPSSNNNRVPDITEKDVHAEDKEYKGKEIKEEASCKICFERDAKALTLPCAHKIMCIKCAFNIKKTKSPCPVCKKSIESVIKVFE